jgi:predicted DsbA family dithiol-disulfide isomerase
MERRYGARVTWLPYDLHPEYPPEGIARDDLSARYGFDVAEQQRALFARWGVPYAPPGRIPNSRNALRLTELARDRGLHERVHHRLMDALWADGRDIGDDRTLRELGIECGLVAGDVDAVLASDEYAERVQASTWEAQAIGVSGIPGFLLDSKLLVLGAHPHAVFEQAFEQLSAA